MNLPLKLYYELLARYLRPQWLQVTCLALVLFGSIALQLLTPQIVRQFIDSAQAGLVAQLLPLGILYLAVALIYQVMRTGTAYLTEVVQWRATNRLRNDLSRHCLQLDMSFHNDNSTGTMIERLDNDVTELSNFFSQFVLQVVGNSVLLIGILGLLYLEDWRIGLAFAVLVVVMLLSWSKTVGIGAPLWTERLAANANLSSLLEEWLNSTEDLKANGIVAYVMQQFLRAHYRIYVATRKAIVVGLTWAFSTMVFDISLAMVLGVGVYLWQLSALTVGTLFMLFQYGKLLQNPLEELARQSQDLQSATASIIRIRELFDTKSKIQVTAEPEALPDKALAVQFDDVDFGYGAGELVLRKINFCLEAGQVLGLLGRTGSGKSTVTRLLLRLYDPAAGTIRLGGIDTRAVSLDDLRHQIGIVTQEVQLFRASVRENLTLFDKSIADQQILDTIELLGLGGWFARLARGLDTALAGGSGLSAGEAQLLAFTRVFLKNPGLVIMDEASSRLDPITEKLIERAITLLLKNRSAIIVAHRLATVERADKIMILRDGEILEFGDRVSLMAEPNSHFSHLLRVGIEEVLE